MRVYSDDAAGNAGLGVGAEGEGVGSAVAVGEYAGLVGAALVVVVGAAVADVAPSDAVAVDASPRLGDAEGVLGASGLSEGVATSFGARKAVDVIADADADADADIAEPREVAPASTATAAAVRANPKQDMARTSPAGILEDAGVMVLPRPKPSNPAERRP